MPDLEQIAADMGELAGEIRDFSRSQVTIWKELPHATLLSVGPEDLKYYPTASLVYAGILVVGEVDMGGLIDCDTGDVFIPKPLKDQGAVDEQVVRTYLADSLKLDALKHLELIQLLGYDRKSRACEIGDSDLSHELVMREWYKQQARELGLTHRFNRAHDWIPQINQGLMRNYVEWFNEPVLA